MKRLRFLNNGVKLEVGKSPKIKFLGKEIMLLQKGDLHMNSLNLCHAAALNAWDIIGKMGKGNGVIS